MKLITEKDRRQLLANRAKRLADPNFDPIPVVHLYTLFHPCDWLLTELDPKQPDVAWTLADLGAGCPEYGSVSLTELAALKIGPAPLVERDLMFRPKSTISTYAREAQVAGRIVL